MATLARRRSDARSAEDGRPAVSVWLRLLKAHGLVRREVRRRVPGGLTLPQFDVLAQLHRHEAGMKARDLTRELLVSPGNVTVVVGGLVRLGLAERSRSSEDRRAVRIRLTARGRRLMQQAIPRHRREVEAVLAPVPGSTLERLRDLLGEMNRALEQRR